MMHGWMFQKYLIKFALPSYASFNSTKTFVDVAAEIFAIEFLGSSVRKK